MNNKGEQGNNVFQVADDIVIKPKDKIIDSYSGGKSADIKFIEPKKNKLFPFLLVGIIICIIILLFTINKNTEEITTKRSTTTTTEVTTTTTEVTTINIDNSEVSNFRAYLSEILETAGSFNDNYEEVVLYKGMYFKFACLSYDFDTDECTSGKGELLLPGATIPLYEFTDEKENFIINRNNLYMALVNDKIMIVKCFDEPGTSSFIIYDLQGHLLTSRNKITTSYYDNKTLQTTLTPSLSDEKEKGVVSFYECSKGHDIVAYSAVVAKNLELKETKLNLPSTMRFSCTPPKGTSN